jgi:superfamily II DNA/RNA helicase
MPKREHETDANYKARKKAKKAKKASNQHLELTNDKNTKKGSLLESNVKPAEFHLFSDAPFTKPIHKALQDSGFTEPSAIQSRAWPAALSGKDVIAVAKTGSGKVKAFNLYIFERSLFGPLTCSLSSQTLGFLLPTFHRIYTNDVPGGSQHQRSDIPSPLCLVLTPTRELAMQIHRECIKFGPFLNIRSECIYGGTNVGAQIKQLRAADPQVLVSTPGRLCDLLERTTAVSLQNCRFCILDESDRMLDLGFEKQLNQVMDVLPKQRQTLLFTATWPEAVRGIARSFLREDEIQEIFVGDSDAGELAANKAVTQIFVEAQDDEKDKKLYDILCGLEENAAVIVFTNTKRRADYVSNIFWREGFMTCAVHGDKAQHERDASLHMFMKRERNIMVATDVAARGLDIKGVTHVINFDMARDVETYVHRIGRTGRAGEIGESITFWNPDYDKACSPALVTIAKNAGQEVPEFLKRYEKTKTTKQWKVTDAEKACSQLLMASIT